MQKSHETRNDRLVEIGDEARAQLGAGAHRQAHVWGQAGRERTAGAFEIGFLEALHVRQESDGSGRVLMECNASSIRYELPIPKATTRERTLVREQQDEGLEPTCPRHSDPIRRLQRAGQFLICPLCGVRYGRPV